MTPEKIQAALEHLESNFTHVERGSAEWDRMWAVLAELTGGDTVEEHPVTGEAWQYMGTYQGVHEFRHRDRPRKPRDASPRQLSSGVGFGRVYLRVFAE
jgi:hypothetical protein